MIIRRGVSSGRLDDSGQFSADMCARRSGIYAAALLAAALLAGGGGALLPLLTERLRAAVGGFAVMNCHLDFPFGNEIPYHLQWDKDGEIIYSWYSGDGEARVADRWGGRVARARGAALGGGALNISAVRDTDAGLYRCRVTFPNRTPPTRNNGTYYYLDVEGGDLIATPPMNVTVVEGERAELECLPRSAEASVSWLKDGAPLSAAPELAARAQLPPNGSLILHATSTDSGQYACRVQLGDRTQLSPAYMDVHYKARVVFSPEELFLAAGKAASLDCHFSANPPLTNLRWEKDGFLFDPYNVPGVFYSRNGSLLFNRVEARHAGVYACTAYNALGSAGAGRGVRVHVAGPPRLWARAPPLLPARAGHAASLPCALHAGDGPATLTWTRKDGQPLPEGRHSIEGGNLTIVDITEEDRGVYVCTVTNQAAQLTTHTELLIENTLPRAPYNLTATVERDAIHLTWVPGHGGANVEFAVWYRESGAAEWRTMKILTRGGATATLRGLQPAATYEVRVLAQDQIGDGLFSKPLYVTTTGLDGAEGGVVTPLPVADDALEVNVRLVEQGALVTWGRPGEGGAPAADDCTLRWYRGDQLIYTAHTHHDYVLVNHVDEGEEYAARVWCAGAGGGGAGGATLLVPAWGRLRTAAGVAAALLVLAAAAAALIAARRCRCWRKRRR